MKKCPYCQLTYDDNTLFYCLNDGKPLFDVSDEPEAETVAINPPPAPPSKSNNKLIPLTIILSSALVSAALILWLIYPASSQSQKCVLYNNDPNESFVMTRINCDKFSCDDDPNTSRGSKPNGTEIQRLNTPAVKSKSKKFNWTQVTILEEAKMTVWVADTKIKCTSQ
ncbi:MAG TPA: hypothetical protein VF721_00885 [Pyrinomonadaceae bacterium]|jgi:hypothetical protein